MRRSHVVLSAVVFVAAGAAVAVTVPAVAATSIPPGSAGTFEDAAAGVDPDVVTAMQRDFRLSIDQVGSRIRRERWAGRTESTLRSQIGAGFAGAWLTADGDKLMVGVTDQAAAARVRAAGAEPRLASTSESDLNGIKRRLDEHAVAAGRSVTGWYVDVTTSTVVVVAKPGGEGAARSLVAAAGNASAVRVVTSTESPQPLYDVRGGDAFYINNSARCSIGFAVQGGFVTAGHCGTAGATTAGSNRVAQGTFQGSSFPGNDYAYVSVNSNWNPVGVVNDFNGGTVAVYGSQEAVVGASICRSGSTTGTHCGVVQAKNATVNYSQGTVTGLTRTNVCAEAGDSGGSWLSGNQAQGVTSGGSGNCTSGGTTYFQPVNEILSAYGLTLVTSGGGTPPSPSPTTTTTRPTTAPTTVRPTTAPTTVRPTTAPTTARPTTTTARPTTAPTTARPTTTTARPTTAPTTPARTTANRTTPPRPTTSPTTPPMDCTDLEASADGELSGTGARRTVPSSGYFRAGTGRHIACLTGPSSADFDLYLQRWTGRGWRTVARADGCGIGQDELLTYSGYAGYYRYRVVSAEGSGPFLLTADIP